MTLECFDGKKWVTYSEEEFKLLKRKKFKQILVHEPRWEHRVLRMNKEINKRLEKAA